MLTSPKPVLVIVDGAIDLTGALTSAARQAKLLADRASTILVLPRGHRVPPQLLSAFDEVIDLPIMPLRKNLTSMLAYMPSLLYSGFLLRREIRRHGGSRLQINDFHFAVGAIVRLLGFRGRIVTWIQIDPVRYGLIGRIWLALARWSSDELVVVSKFIAGQLPTGYRSKLIYNAIPLVDHVRRSASQGLLFIGNYIEGKGQDSAILAFHQIAARFPEVELVFYGSDMGLAKNRKYRAHLAQIAQSGAGKRRIYLRDFVQNTSVAYGQAYAALNFSHSESFSLTCLEASAHGLPVIATRCGGPEEIIDDGDTGYLVAVGDIDAMADRMADLLDDPNKAASMGEAGRRLVNKRFGTEQFRHQVLEIFDWH